MYFDKLFVIIVTLKLVMRVKCWRQLITVNKQGYVLCVVCSLQHRWHVLTEIDNSTTTIPQVGKVGN